MKNKLQLMFLLVLLLLGCEKDELSKTIDFEQFKMDVPSDWESFTSQSIDSKTGGIKNGKDELTYDYGWYSYDLKKETISTHTRTTTNIDGKPALIVKPRNKGKGIIGVFIQVDAQTKFNLLGRDIKNEDVVVKIFESIKF